MTKNPDMNTKAPRVSFILISITQLFCALPLLNQVSPWVIALCCLCYFWRTMVYQGRWNYPHRYIRYGFIIVAVAGIMLQYPRLLNIQPAITLLVVTYYLKLLEMHSLKDVYVILILSFFIMAATFLFHDDIYMLLYLCVALMMTMTALVSINRQSDQNTFKSNSRLGIKLFCKSIPISICLFLFFPRFDPFWVLDVKKPGFTTGIDDSMSPADVAELGAEDGIAFRAEIDSTHLSQSDLYWRVLTLTRFDGKNWRSSFSGIQSQEYFKQTNIQHLIRLQQDASQVFRYKIQLEPTEQVWLPALDMPVRTAEKSFFMPDYSIFKDKPIYSPITYEVESSKNVKTNLLLSDWSRDENLKLPLGFNPKTQKFAEEELAKVHGDPALFIQNIMQYFKSESFFYTLKPGKYGDNMVDEFLFGRRKGFCAHYSSAMAIVLRNAGIPSRIVVGYHGGEINPIGGHMVVHQYDAHSWVEAWMQGQGWVRFDPTAMVAPWRLLVGVEQMMRQTSTSEVPALDQALFKNSDLFNRVRLLVDYSNYSWNKYVINFNRVFQEKLFSQFFKNYSYTDLIGLMVGSIGLFLSILYYLGLRKSAKRFQYDADRYLHQVLKILERKYLQRQPGQSLEYYLELVRSQLKPNEAAAVEHFFKLYSNWAYLPLKSHQKSVLVRQLKKQSYQLSRQLNHIF